MCHCDVEITVVVEVTDSDTLTEPAIAQVGLLGDVLVMPVAQVAKQSIAIDGRFCCGRPRAALCQIQVRKSVRIVVKHSYAASGEFVHPCSFDSGIIGIEVSELQSGLGGAIGPDLTSIPHKFDERYLVEAIVDPSKNISDQYGSSVVTLTSGGTQTGLVIEDGDSIKLYPPDAKAEPTIIARKDIKSIAQSPVSQMPPGLLNVLNQEEVRDLVAYLMAGGNPKDRRYRR